MQKQDQLQNLFLEGEWAGGKATASSVISDLYEIASNSNIIFSVVTHKNTKYGDYILVLDQLKQANATKISIANPPSF